VVEYAEIAAAANQRRHYEEKVVWFQEICRERLRIKWSDDIYASSFDADIHCSMIPWMRS
jgi:hypothetical protein